MGKLLILKNQSLVVYNLWVLLEKGVHCMPGMFHVPTGEPEL